MSVWHAGQREMRQFDVFSDENNVNERNRLSLASFSLSAACIEEVQLQSLFNLYLIIRRKYKFQMLIDFFLICSVKILFEYKQ